MRIKKTVTEKVIAANRANGKKGTGAKTQRGKDVVSQNATKHGILAQNFRFKDNQEEADYNTLISDLDGSIDRDDPLQRMLTEEFAIAHFRRGRALKLEQRLCQRQNPATELALKTIENSKLVDTGICLRRSRFRVGMRRADHGREERRMTVYSETVPWLRAMEMVNNYSSTPSSRTPWIRLCGTSGRPLETSIAR